MKTLITVLLVFMPSTAVAWSAAGHHVIAVAAFEMMPLDVRSEVMEILSHHPDFDKHFNPPSGMSDQGSIDRWRIGVAGCWPDIIRRTDYDRPTWHYQLGATMVIGSAKSPSDPPPVKRGATMGTQQQYIGQALRTAFSVFADDSNPKPERAIALCWILHLVADSHQPCHAGSLYAKAFKGGDRGANQIKLAGGGNLHAAWDRLLGSRATANGVRSRVAELGDIRKQLDGQANEAGSRWLLPEQWLTESRQLGRSDVYSDTIIDAVTATSRGITKRLPELKLPNSYFQSAGLIARTRAKQASHRLSLILTNAINDPS